MKGTRKKQLQNTKTIVIMKDNKLILMLAQSLIGNSISLNNKVFFYCNLFVYFIKGTGFFFLYVHHVRSLFESRSNVAHITQMQRESLFRREDALYYSFYKTLTEAPDFWTGLDELSNLTTIEYPHSVNVLNRFNVLPEITIG